MTANGAELAEIVGDLRLIAQILERMLRRVINEDAAGASAPAPISEEARRGAFTVVARRGPAPNERAPATRWPPVSSRRHWKPEEDRALARFAEARQLPIKDWARALEEFPVLAAAGRNARALAARWEVLTKAAAAMAGVATEEGD